MLSYYRCTVLIGGLLICPRAYSDSGLSGAIGFAELIVFSFLIWVVSSVYAGVYLFKNSQNKGLIILAPVIPLLILLSLYTLGMIIGIGLTSLSSSVAERVGIFISVPIHVLACYYVYRKSKEKWIKKVIERLIAPLLALGSIMVIFSVL